MQPRLNVLWIVTTQWRAQATGHAGDLNARTPALDAFSERCTNFVEAVTPHPFGPFARAAMLTGQESPANGVRDYFDPLPTGTDTIAHEMHELGYTSSFFGKWHLASRDRSAPLVGEAHARMVVPEKDRGGFKFWEGFESGFQLHNPWLHGTRLAEPTQFPGYQSDVVCRRAADWLLHQTSGPWFSVVSVEPPHPPYGNAPGAERADPVRIRLRQNVPASAETADRARLELSGYYAHIEATDRAIGDLLARIDLSSTAVVITSVHGDMHGSHGLFRKGWPYEESVRVPFLVYVPGHAPRVSREHVSLVDLPTLTIAAACGEEVGFRREFARISMPSVVALEDQCDRVWRGCRSSRRKLIVNADGKPWLYFDLESDPLELRNVANESGRQREMEQILRLCAAELS